MHTHLIEKRGIHEYFEKSAARRVYWNQRNRFYHKQLEKYFSHIIPEGSLVMEIGCGTGDLLHAVKPSVGIGIDFSENVLKVAAERHPLLKFLHVDFEENDCLKALSDLGIEKVEYIILSDLLHVLWDVQKMLINLRKLCSPSTRIVISNYNFLWEPILKSSEFLGLKQKSPNSNWLSRHDIVNILELEGYQAIRSFQKILLPVWVPVLNFIFNKVLVNLPLFNQLGMITFIIARPSAPDRTDYSVSIIIPARNEKGNIRNAITRTPVFGTHQQFVFVEGHSADGTYEEMLQTRAAFPEKDIAIFKQTGRGKGDAVRLGFENATGELLMILDSDLTTPPEDLVKFYNAVAHFRGEFINGCRLVYPMEKQAMRFLNLLGNKFFSLLFTYLLGQKLKDTLCGTKVLLKKDYDKIIANRSYFGDFDPFGDFDLLFGAAKLNLRIMEVIVRYKDRTYGTTQISRFKHGLLLLRMSLYGMVKLKLF